MAKFQVGQKVRVIGDSFKADPHGLEIGSVYTIESISPATPFNEFPPFVKFMFAMKGMAGYDLPERVHVKTGDNPFEDFANIVFEDLEFVVEDGTKIRMTDDDYAEGYFDGDVFEVRYDKDGEAYFIDRDGDIRYLDGHDHVVI